VQALAGQTKISIEVDTDERAVVIGDPALLEQAVLALLDNAINYNRAGGRVMVRTAVKDEQALLEVEDTGIGIARAHGGTLTLTSIPDQGTTVTLTLPLAHRTASARRDGAPGNVSVPSERTV
jgi:signal transduction histidine kinase